MDLFFDVVHLNYIYYGRLNEIDFLKRIYDLNNMPSYDSRFSNAEEDIVQHTILNDDYEYCWVFEDERFQLKDGEDRIYLEFICEIFHPEVRDEKVDWKPFLQHINSLLRNDGFELYPVDKISNRDIYGWRIYDPNKQHFTPFSVRLENSIKKKHVNLKIKRQTRYQIYKLLTKYDEQVQIADTNGWIQNILIHKEVFNKIREYYIPKSFDENDNFTETEDLKQFILYTRPYWVIDFIEFFSQNVDKDFEERINGLLKKQSLDLELTNGKIVVTTDAKVTHLPNGINTEVGVLELLQDANFYYEDGNLAIAVEKLWDAFERLKTYFGPTLNKKNSANKIINIMSSDDVNYKKIFDKEFNELTKIGNDFRIRHHEINKINIEDNRHYEYFYKRCLTLVTTAIKFIENDKLK